ncbi:MULTISPECIES: CopG family ribbon-helix-helix protein [unclassified Serratia (in: enterobacteria)]|uniref:CopG family ribbon-helix-helix protein n=1 Tax=unclassified Serratia (in: enterobacteria) TaxID=2647522 RepID=UPI003076103B
MSVMSVRLSDELSEQLEALAEATGRTKSFLAVQAIRDFLNREAWQVAEIQQAILEADNGDFASSSEMTARFKRMGVFDPDGN